MCYIHTYVGNSHRRKEVNDLLMRRKFNAAKSLRKSLIGKKPSPLRETVPHMERDK